jgi:ubiquinone/menaquinone biosynthesis C-methylase UbiE
MSDNARKHTWTASGRKDRRETDWINDRIKARMDFHPDLRVIDIGCGDGTFLATIPSAESVGISPETDVVEENSERFPHLKFIVGESKNVSLPDAWADRVVLNGVLPVLDSKEEMLQSIAEAARLLKRGGQFWLGEVRSGYNPEVALLGSVLLGKILRPWLSANTTYFKHFRKAKRLIEKDAIILGADEIENFTVKLGLTLVWQEPSFRFLNGTKLISPIRRDYQFKKL